MKALRFRLGDEAKRVDATLETVQKDYLISYMLAGISYTPELSSSLILKGGTALRKLHFPDYRLSEDLDFTADRAPQGEQLETGIRTAVAAAVALLHEQAPFSMNVERYTEREPHPHGQEAFVLHGRFPWQSDALCRIKVEVTFDEPVLLPAERLPLLHGYGESLSCLVSCYALEEVVAEKLRALLQTHEKLVTRGWNRPRTRDYYDLWRVLRERGAHLSMPVIADLLRRKAGHRQVRWNTRDDFFTAELVREARRTWRNSLSPFVADVPECETVLSELRDMLAPLLDNR